MKSRLVPMLLTGVGLALGLLVTVQVVQSTRRSENPAVTSDLALPDDLNKTVFPVIFKTISEQNGKLRLSGTSEPNAVINVRNHNENLRQIKAGNDGNWTLSISVTDSELWALDLMAYVEGGGVVRSDETVYRIQKQDNAPVSGFETLADTEIVDQDIAEQPRPALIMVTAPGGPTRVVQSPFGVLPNSGGLSMGPVDYDARGSVIFSGSSEIDGIVRIYAKDEIVGQRRVNANGRWYFIAAEALPSGIYDIRAEIETVDGIINTVTVPFKRLEAEALANEREAPFSVEYTDSYWQLSRTLYGGGHQITAIFAPPLEPEE